MSAELPSFIQKYKNIVKNKKSVLCVGLDPALPDQRNNYVMPTSDRISFMKEIIEEVSSFTSIIKMNRQYLIGLNLEQIQGLNDLIHKQGMLSIIDHKLGDIGSSNDSAIFWFRKEGFDAFTHSPFAGNIEEATLAAHERDLGIIVLTLMSNPEAVIQKTAHIGSNPLYLFIAQQCLANNVDGCVVGATGNVEFQNLSKLKATLGHDILVLVPGVGVQGGNAEEILKMFGKRTMVNVGRSIIYSPNPKQEAEKFCKMFNKYIND
ncbi:MAG: orotidine 5'-phosphate decarboxylase [Candidatus Heimdallarchaeota archaeon]|nr:MAG: orotidine 5'-phosphate decarboxylase [Candidatus Heimdallarchaeota archaeon]